MDESFILFTLVGVLQRSWMWADKTEPVMHWFDYISKFQHTQTRIPKVREACSTARNVEFPCFPGWFSHDYQEIGQVYTTTEGIAMIGSFYSGNALWRLLSRWLYINKLRCANYLLSHRAFSEGNGKRKIHISIYVTIQNFISGPLYNFMLFSHS